MQVTLSACKTIRFAPHPLHDGGQYDSWDGFRTSLDGEGYGGGVRLLKAMCKVFLHECEERGLQLPEKNFELTYETNIPRQAGLSGSSAIACAALNCLLAYYDIGDRCIASPEKPSQSSCCRAVDLQDILFSYNLNVRHACEVHPHHSI